jgi:ABC-2 type transport system permease protein
MKPILTITWTHVKLSYRTKVAFFFMVVMPVGFFFLYCGLFGRGQADAVASLMQPLVTFLAITSGLYGVGGTLVALRERDVLRRYHLAPLSAVQIVMSNILATYITFMPIVFLMFVLARLLYHMPLSMESALGVLVVLSLGYMAVGGIGMVVAGLVNTAQEAQILMQVLFFALLFLSGSAVPLDHLPGFLQHLALFLPPTMMILSGQGIMVARQSLMLHIPELLALALTAISSLVLAAVLFRWEKEAKVSAHRWKMAGLAITPMLLVGAWLNTSPAFHRVNDYLLHTSKPSAVVRPTTSPAGQHLSPPPASATRGS